MMRKARRSLADKLASLALLPPAGQAVSPLAAQVTGQHYAVETNEFGIKEVALDFADSAVALTAQVSNGRGASHGGYGEWREGSMALFGGKTDRTAASGVWTAADTFVLTVRLYETPFVHTLTFQFSGDDLRIDGDVNVGFEAQKFSLMAQRSAN